MASIVEAADSALGSRGQALEAAITAQVKRDEISTEVADAAAAVQAELALTEAGAAIGDEKSTRDLEFLKSRGLLARFAALEEQRYGLRAELDQGISDRVERARKQHDKAESQLTRKLELGAKVAERCHAEKPLDLEMNVAGVWVGATACRSLTPSLRGRFSFWTS